MNFYDLFAGIGGFHYAISNISKNATPLLVCEIDNYAKETYALNHNYNVNDIINIREVTENEEALMDLNNDAVDFIFAGFPCQAFSNAGNKAGFMDKTRGTLFFDVATLIAQTRPKFVLLENVKHLANHDNGETWKTIIKTLKELNYWVSEEPLILSPDFFGIPQNRERVFIPAFNSDHFEDEVILSKADFDKYAAPIKQINMDDNIDGLEIDNQLTSIIDAWGDFIQNVKRIEGRTLPVIWLDYMNDDDVDYSGMSDWKIKYIKDMKNVYKLNKEFIDNWMDNNNVITWGKRDRKLEWQAGKDEYNYRNAFIQLRQSGIRFRSKRIFPTLVAMVQIPIIFNGNIWRKLSINEVRQLQSFPTNFKNGDIPWHQTYKQFGNSINVKVAEYIIREMLNHE